MNRFSNHIESVFNLPPSEKSEDIEITLTDLFDREDLPRTIIFIDAVDELHDLDINKIFPKSTRKNILLIISCLSDTNPVYCQLTKEEYLSKVISIEKMDRDQLIYIVSGYLNNFGKKLDSKQMDRLMSFDSSKNPLWLLSACEELRIHGDYSTLITLITSLPETIADLNRMVIKRLTEQDQSNIMFDSRLSSECVIDPRAAVVIQRSQCKWH